VLSLLATLIIHLPWLPLAVQAAGQQFLYLTGHEHTWSLFAANPRNYSISMQAEIELEDGTVSVWTPQRYGSVGGDLIHYRAVRWQEFQYTEPDPTALTAFAGWLADRSHSEVAIVEVIATATPTSPPGDPPLPSSSQGLVIYRP
jgi:hypothetical protein